MAAGRGDTVRHFARNYIIEQLQVNGYVSQAEELRGRCNADNCCDDEDAEEILHKIAEQLTKERGKHFEKLCNNLELHEGNVLSMYDRIVTELFVKDIHWGGVVTLVSFTGVLVVHLARHGLEKQIPNTLERMDSVIHHKVLPWIILKGGWVSISLFMLYQLVNLCILHSQHFGSTLMRMLLNLLHCYMEWVLL